MVAYVLDDILKRGAQRGIVPQLERKSRDWFMRQAAKTSISPNRLIQSDLNRLRNGPRLGDMYLFGYDPKGKNELPYYDNFPLIIPFNADNKGFYGINFHYLPQTLRARLLDLVLNYITNTELNEQTRFRFTWRMLNKAATVPVFKPCVKRYLYRQVRTKFFYIEPKEWPMAVFLPLERFSKMNKETIHRDSRKIIQG